MTIASLVRGRAGTYNALLVDTGALRSDGALAQHDKLHRLFGDTYVTCVGDASLLAVLLAKVRTSKKRPNLREPNVVAALYSELEGARKNGLLLGVPTAFPPAPPCTTLVVYRAEAFFWKVEFDAAASVHLTPPAPTFLDAESMVVLRGVTVANITGFSTVALASAEEVIVDQMVNVNSQLEMSGADKLRYEMNRRVSGIILPHKTSEAATRLDPGVPQMVFRGLAEPPP